MHYFSLAGVLVPLVLYVDRSLSDLERRKRFAADDFQVRQAPMHAEAAGVVIVLALVIEVVVSAITGKKGNATER